MSQGLISAGGLFSSAARLGGFLHVDGFHWETTGRLSGGTWHKHCRWMGYLLLNSCHYALEAFKQCPVTDMGQHDFLWLLPFETSTNMYLHVVLCDILRLSFIVLSFGGHSVLTHVVCIDWKKDKVCGFSAVSFLRLTRSHYAFRMRLHLPM